jgi:hypothetical protein
VSSLELYSAAGFMAMGLLLVLLLRRGPKGSRWRDPAYQAGAALVLASIGIGLLALYLNAIEIF